MCKNINYVDLECRVFLINDFLFCSLPFSFVLLNSSSANAFVMDERERGEGTVGNLNEQNRWFRVLNLV